ncbi:MAG: AraC family transcriptional regulator [Cyclobacteriaceae bacterium]|nr:AraC family transcriptional regulator [Cyclobacteriaceae bacterium]
MSLTPLISIAGIAIALFTCSLIATRGNIRLADGLLISWILALALNQTYFLLTGIEFAGTVTLPANWHLFGISTVLLHSPLLFLFAKYAFSSKFGLGELVHVLPFALFMIGFSILVSNHPDKVVFRYGLIGFKENLLPFTYYGLFLAFVAGAYTVAAFLAIRKHKAHLSQTHSSEIRNVLNWLQYWIIAAIIFFIATYLAVELSVTNRQFDSRFTFQVVSVFITFYIVYVSFWGIRKTDAFRNLAPIELNLSTTLVTNNEDADELAQALQESLERGRHYLDPDLSLIRLAEIMKTPAGKLSYVINSCLGKNFYDFVNEYRVKEFLKRLPDKQYAHLSLLGLAFECGFRSKSTFNSFFKKQTGQTPSAYKKNLEKKSG